MPQDNYGDRDRYASDALRNIIPKHWKFKPPRDSDSGSEVCQDWVIEILDDEREWTGAEFTVQNKTEIKIYKEHVSTVLTVDCLIYLLDKVIRPVMIHVYDIDNEISYWIWLSQWQRIGERSEWMKNKTVAIQIPKNNVLSNASIPEIQRFVIDFHWKASIRKRVDIENVTNSDFTFSSPEFIDNNIISIAQPKHDNAKFDIVVDEDGKNAIQHLIEKGYAVQVPIISEKFHSPFKGIAVSDSDILITLIPHKINRIIPLKLLFLDAQDNVLLEHGYVPFTIERQGTIEQKLRGKPPSVPMIYIFLLQQDSDTEGTLNTQITFEPALDNPHDPLAVKALYDVYENMSHATKLKIVQLETDTVLTTFDLPVLQKIHEGVRRYVDAAFALKQEHDIHIPVPNEINDQLLWAAELSLDILTKKKSQWVNKPESPNWKIPVTQIQRILLHFTEKGFVQITTASSHIEMKIFDTKIDLGQLRSVYYVTQIKNIDEIKGKLAKEEVSENNLITVDIEIDFEKSFTEQVKLSK